MFDIRPTDSSPIWQQIEEGMRRMIALGSLRPGEAVPSVRDLARTLRVNPNTVARAYQRLTDNGVFSVKRGDGTYVADAPSQPRRSVRDENLREAATRYAGAAIAAGASATEACEVLKESFAKLVKEHRKP